MKSLLVAALLVPLALVACAVDPASTDADGVATDEASSAPQRPEGAANANDGENVGQSRSDLMIGGSSGLTPFCLPGEIRKCTLGPPPVCHCELPKIGPITTAAY